MRLGGLYDQGSDAVSTAGPPNCVALQLVVTVCAIGDSAPACRSDHQSATVTDGGRQTNATSGAAEADTHQRACQDGPSATGIAWAAALFRRVSSDCGAVGLGRPMEKDVEPDFRRLSPRTGAASSTAVTSTDQMTSDHLRRTHRSTAVFRLNRPEAFDIQHVQGRFSLLISSLFTTPNLPLG